MRNRRLLELRKIDFFKAFSLAALFAAGAIAAPTQTLDQTWLRHGYFHGLPPAPMHVRALSREPAEKTAVKEIVNGVERLFGSAPSSGGDRARDAIVVGTVQEFRSAYPTLDLPSNLAPEGFWVAERDLAGKRLLVIAGGGERGVLYGAFALVREIATTGWDPKTKITEAPAMPIRWVDEWDNANGTIERGYGGRSIFFENGKVRDDLSAVRRIRAAAGVGRHQRLQREQRQRRRAVPDAGDDPRPQAHCRRYAPVGRAARHQRRHRQPAKDRRPQDLRSARSRQ